MGMDDRDGVIWMDGEYLPWREARVHVLTHTLHYGMGVFEGVRAYKTDSAGTAIFRNELFSEPLPLGIISMRRFCGSSLKSM